MAGEPLYDLNTRSWTGTCPCIRAEQKDPECPWHGKPEFRAGPNCANCGAVVDRDRDGAWRHAVTGNYCCPGGEPFGEVATPESNKKDD